MDYAKTQKWLSERKITLEESFTDTLKKYAVEYKKNNGIRLLNDVYRMLGCTKQDVSWWKYHPESTQTKNNHKPDVIINAGRIFCFGKEKTEHLANQAGLMLQKGLPFSDCFAGFSIKYTYKNKNIFEKANISERMYEYKGRDETNKRNCACDSNSRGDG